MKYQYTALHIPSGRTFVQDFTIAQVEEGLHPHDPDLFASAGVLNEIALEAVNRWNQAGGITWKYWI